MGWLTVSGGVALRVGLVALFFWALIGQYAYREAMKERRSAPKLRGVGWWVLGVVGAVTYLAHDRERKRTRLAWLAFSLLLFAFWAVATIGRGELDRAFYAWAALFGGLFILYWQFDLETADD